MEDNLQAAIDEGNDLIVVNSFDSVDAVTRLAAEHPDQKWAIVDWPSRARTSAASCSRSMRARTSSARRSACWRTGTTTASRRRTNRCRRGGRPAVHPALVRRLRGGCQEGQPRCDARPGLGDRLQRPRDEQGARARPERQGRPVHVRVLGCRQHRHLRGSRGAELPHQRRRHRPAVARPGPHHRVDGEADRRRRARGGARPRGRLVRGRRGVPTGSPRTGSDRRSSSWTTSHPPVDAPPGGPGPGPGAAATRSCRARSW